MLTVDTACMCDDSSLFITLHKFLQKADPIFNGSKVVRSIQMMRSYHRLPVGPEPPHLKIRGAPLHPWSMYTDKGGVNDFSITLLHSFPLTGFFFGVGTQLPRNFFPKFLATTSAIMGVTYGLVWLYNAAGVLDVFSFLFLVSRVYPFVIGFEELKSSSSEQLLPFCLRSLS